jgi:hypothetical protein
VYCWPGIQTTVNPATCSGPGEPPVTVHWRLLVPNIGLAACTVGAVLNVSSFGGVAPTVVFSNDGSKPAPVPQVLTAPPTGAGGHMAWSRNGRYGSTFG